MGINMGGEKNENNASIDYISINSALGWIYVVF